MEFRKAERNDIPMLVKLRKLQLVDEGMEERGSVDHELESYFETCLTEGTLVEWLAEEDGAIIATAAIAFLLFPPAYGNPVGTRGYITNMYTAPAYRGRGIAKLLLARLEEEAKKRAVHRLLLSASDMGASVYETCGFSKTGRWMEKDV